MSDDLYQYFPFEYNASSRSLYDGLRDLVSETARSNFKGMANPLPLSATQEKDILVAHTTSGKDQRSLITLGVLQADSALAHADKASKDAFMTGSDENTVITSSGKLQKEDKSGSNILDSVVEKLQTMLPLTTQTKDQ